MDINLLGQGYEENSENSVGYHLIKFFADKGFHTFTGISAFVSQAGIRGLSKYIHEAKTHLNIITIVTGVDQEGTSKEALEELLQLDINAYVFYQPSRSIFHPKIYLFEGDEKSELIIGSSNLTSQGLFSNVEASLHVSINNKVDTEKKIVEQLKEYFNGIFDFSDPNLKKLNEEIIEELVKARIVPTEEERMATHDKPERNETENIISTIFPKRAIAKIPSEFRRVRKSTIKKTVDFVESSVDVIYSLDKEEVLVWESGKLTERDLNIPKGLNTNPTGSMLFKKGKMTNIDQRHYFRNEVFASLTWQHGIKPETSHLERTVAIFQIFVEGNDEGTFNLTITHNTKTNTPSYRQNNSMTQIRWGDAKKIIAKDNLIGKSAKLFKTNQLNYFILRIE